MDKQHLLHEPVATFEAGSSDLFGFTPFQGGGGGSEEEFYIHSFSLNVGPIPEPASMALLSLGGLAMLRRRRA